MAYYDQKRRRPVSLAHAHHALITLIAIHLVLFIILYFIRVIYSFNVPDQGQAVLQFEQFFFSWFTLPASAAELLHKPWTLLTHMFVHNRIWDVVGNVLWLWGFGFILQDLTGNRKIVPVFLYGALVGAVLYLLVNNLLPALQALAPYRSYFGAGAGVMAIAAAATTLAPGYRIFPMLNGGIPIWILTILFVIIDLTTIPANNSGIYLAHLGGFATGYLFIYFFRKGVDLGGWMNNFYDWFLDLFNPDKPEAKKSFKQELFYKSPVKPFKKSPNVTEGRIDEILDKINADGYESLTDEEKELLRKAGKE